MKKKIMMLFMPQILLLLLFLFVLLGTGGSSGSTIEVPAAQEDAYKYQYISSELGVPWEITLIVDGFHAWEDGKGDVSGYNPMLTSLEFCSIIEKAYVWEEYEIEDTNSTGLDASENEGAEEPVETEQPSEPSGEWILSSTKAYEGKKEILDYLGVDETLQYQDAPLLITKTNNTALQKSSGEMKYEAAIVVNTDHQGILRRIGFHDEDIAEIMELYHSHYYMYLYGFDEGFLDFEVVLPPLVVGNVTRNEFMQVASSLMGLTYLFGGKSSSAGVPISGLDCSGYVDWVYMQCFGQGVSGGSLPAGVSMAGTALQFYACSSISESELKAGDLGFYYDPATLEPGKVNHVGIYIGKIDGYDAFIHSGGSFFGTDNSPSGRVGISVNQIGVYNSYNPITGGNFDPAMRGSNFKYFRRPNFQFEGDDK